MLSEYSAGARGLNNSFATKTLVAGNVIFLCISSPDANGWLKLKGLVAFVETATFCFIPQFLLESYLVFYL